ncbi:MAG: ATP-grasp domain-containing protein [Actinobacteria bacterium]|nr:ATP-grasp domain-containing protein [Actinomycetota bacterium]
MAQRPRSARARLLVLGAGPGQLGLLEAARARADLHVVAADRDATAVGFALADERAIVSTEDEHAVEQLARALRVDGIVSPGADWPVRVAARAAERLGLPHPIDSRTAVLATSKLHQRERFRDAGVPHAAALDPAGRPVVPCVVKAPDRQGQRGLTLVRDEAGLVAALAEARAESRSGAVLVEELVDGPEITVNGAWSDVGAFRGLAVTDRVTAEPPAFGVALAHVWPSAAAGDGVLEIAEQACRALGLVAGPVYVQLRIGADGPQVMEVAARLGGGHDAELVRAVTGVDLNAVAIAAALGEPCDPLLDAPDASPAGAGCIRFLVAPPGRLLAVEGVEEAERGDGVGWVRVYREPGWTFGPLRRGADRAGAILATGADWAEAVEKADRAADTVRFRVDAPTA